ncbi:hypothetical protein NXW18_04780 [Bacteroides thetaiotaomicron]|uniref:hypothetical protein n=1 Tax=Bacteroides thetaiotaomicron TaxID=818 RepID=UPI002165C4FA|nr:hypothetical protein [Bacteroides thetaiotaomicron]MCS2873057.1 hypothetical protein [Bacteroides thetaiotaomicron]
MQEQKMIDESLLLRYFEKEVNEEEQKKVEEWIHSSEANRRMAQQVARIFVATRLLHVSKEASPPAGVTKILEPGRAAETQTYLAIYKNDSSNISSPHSYSGYYLLVFR